MAAVQPGAQQPSVLAQVVIAWRVHRTSQPEADVRVQVAQASAGGHVAGQEPGSVPVSHVSDGGSTTAFPQVAGQSVSIPACAFAGQQPSPFRVAVVVTNTHRALQVCASTSRSSVQGTPSEQVLGQAPAPVAMAVSQLSPVSTLPFPQVAEQSGSVAVTQPVGQQPSVVGKHALVGVAMQAAEQAPAEPCIK